MSIYDEIDQLLKKVDALVGGARPETMVRAAEARLGVSFPPSFREYLLKWGNVSFNGTEYYGLTPDADFDNSGIPNCVWFTLRERVDVGLPQSLVIFCNQQGDEFICIDTDQALEKDERRVVVWDNIEQAISDSFPVDFATYLHEELTESAGGPGS